MTSNPALFDLAPGDDPGPAPEQTPAQRLRVRQAARIATGVHPLAIDGASLRLHPDAGTPGGPTCGTCVYRVAMGGHAKDYPKCVHGTTVTPIPPEQQRKHGPTRIVTQPRVTSGAATDVRASWPACTDWEAKPPAEPATTPPPAAPARTATDDPWES